MSEKSLTPRALAVVITVTALTLAACNNSDNTTSKLANTASTAQTPSATAPPAPPAPEQPTSPIPSTPATTTPSNNAEDNTNPTTNQNTEEGKLVPIGMIVGNYDDYDQVTINFAGTNTPEWTAEYIDNPTQQGSGRPIKYDGDHALNLYIKNVAMPFEVGRDDPNLSPVPGIGPAVSEVRSGGTFEGQAQFVIGLKDSKHPYKVRTEQNPTRLIIDVQH